uniref:ATG16 autophagy related 16-like 2 (S. cerevisiae) n=1 Tax=Tetraodon nigroviridis TaxID=99883 RepID=H3C6U7_TETNG
MLLVLQQPSCGHGVLAASYDRSALLWQRGSAVPKLTLTGHSRKVTAARFCTLPHQAATGSADRTIRHWDLHRAACVQLVQVASYCSDLVCADHLIISGHYDRKVRVWDSRMLSCIQELPVHGRITSLDINSDHRQLLSCCRDNSLQLIDLRRWSKDCMFFRADGFICGSDSTKAVIRSVLFAFSFILRGDPVVFLHVSVADSKLKYWTVGQAGGCCVPSRGLTTLRGAFESRQGWHHPDLCVCLAGTSSQSSDLLSHQLVDTFELVNVAKLRAVRLSER